MTEKKIKFLEKFDNNCTLIVLFLLTEYSEHIIYALSRHYGDFNETTGMTIYNFECMMNRFNVKFEEVYCKIIDSQNLFVNDFFSEFGVGVYVIIIKDHTFLISNGKRIDPNDDLSDYDDEIILAYRVDI